MDNKYLIFGIGNFGEGYSLTRHNLGARLIEYLITSLKLEVFNKRKYKCALLKPYVLAYNKSYMNCTGPCVQDAMLDFQIDTKNIVVVHDDLQLATGKMLIRHVGSLLGHNGLKDISNKLFTADFTRLRLGIDRPDNKEDVIYYVNEKFTYEQELLIATLFEHVLTNHVELFSNYVTKTDS